ncbi:hypothetical protein IMC15_002426 [Salmonella enterica]|nr:hypothetical protein [Salmonella enterica]EIQ7033925.1 hypothetical protein [Salmonella enterica]
MKQEPGSAVIHPRREAGSGRNHVQQAGQFALPAQTTQYQRRGGHASSIHSTAQLIQWDPSIVIRCRQRAIQCPRGTG